MSPTTLQPYNQNLDSTWHVTAEFRPADMVKWATEYTFGNTATFNEELETYLPGNVFIDANGNLVLQARNTGGGDPSVASGKYTSGTVQSWNAANFKYGFLEGKLQMPGGKGVWPAFWMLLKYVNQSNEVDIVEIFENATILNRGIHYENPVGTKHSDGGSTTVADMTQAFHYYQFSWTPTNIDYYQDGVHLFGITSSVEFPPDVMYILLNVAVGGVVTSGAPLDSQFPFQMTIEYVRLWQRATSDYILNLIPQAPAYGSYLAALLNYSPGYLYRFDEASGTVLTDVSGNGRNGTYSGAGVTYHQPSLITGDGDYSVAFNGSTGYAATPFDPTGLTQLSIAGTFEMPSVITNDGRWIASGHTDANHNGFEMVIRANGAGGLVSVGWGSNSIDIYWSLANSATLQASTIYHYGFSYDGQYVHVYLNGALIGTGSSSGVNAITSSGFFVNIGRGPYNNDYCAVHTDEVAIYPNTVLGAADFLALYNRAITAPTHAATTTVSDATVATATISDSAIF